MKILSFLFYPIFFLLFLFSFFLIEGEYKFYLFSAWSIFILFFSQKLVNVKQSLWPLKSPFLISKSSVSHVRTVRVTLFFIGLLIVSTIFSTHIPLSLEKLPFYMVSFALFLFFIQIPEKKYKLHIFLFFLSLTSFLLNVFVLFSTFFTSSLMMSSGMNLLVRTYGHNHYAAYLLLMIPIFWWQLLFPAEQEKIEIGPKEIRFLSFILLISSYLLIILSLGRLVLLLSLLQLLVIFWLNKNKLLNLIHSQVIYVFLKSFLLIFLVLTVVFMLLSFYFSITQAKQCPLIFNNKELCEPLFSNHRFQYWQKAFWVWQEKPLFGFGLKTFNFRTRQFIGENQSLTSYAHNIFLHTLAEGGLILGVPFILLILYLFAKSWFVARSNQEPLDQFLWLAAVTSLFNAMFDFDWHFFMLFSLTLVFLAFILQKEQNLNKINHKFCYTYFSWLAVFTTILAGANLLASFWIKQNQFDRVAKHLPFLDRQVRSLVQKKRFSIIDLERLYNLYRFDPDFLYNFSQTPDLPKDRQVTLLIELSEIDPLFVLRNLQINSFSPKQVKPLTDKIFTIAINKQLFNNNYFLDYWEQRNLATNLFNLANQAYESKDLQVATDFYHQAYLLNPFIFGDLKPVFLTETDLSRSAEFLLAFQKFNPDSMQDFYSYMSLYHRTLLYLFKNNYLNDFFMLADAMFKQQYNFSWFLFRDLVELSVTKEEKQRLLTVYEKYQDMSTWDSFLPIIEKIQDEFAH